MMSEPDEGIRVLVVEDHDLLAQSLRFALSAEGFHVKVPRPDHDSVLASLAAFTPDVALLDLDLGDDIGPGDALVEPLCRAGVSVVVVSATEDTSRLAQCLERGALGLMPKSRPLTDLIQAVRSAASGQPIMQEAVRQQMLADLRRTRAQRRSQLAPFLSLTPREGFVLSCIVDGKSAQQIATESFVSEATVRSQIRAVLSKLGVRSQLAATAEVRRVGWSYDATSAPGRRAAAAPTRRD